MTDSTTMTNSRSTQSKDPAPEKRRKFADTLRVIAPWGTVASLGLLVIVFGILKPDPFLTSNNLKIIASESALLGIVAAGLTLVLISWDFDLSVGAMASLAGITTALLLREGLPLFAAILMPILLGAVIGLVNGLLVARLRVSAFIATLAMLTILGGIADWWTHSSSVPINNATFNSLDVMSVLGIPLPTFVAIVVFVGLWVLLERTRPGRLLYAVGANPEAAYIAGISVRTVRICAFVGAAMFAAVAGVLLASRLSGGYLDAGEPFLLQAFAAVFLGAVTIRPGRVDMLGTAVGILVLAVLRNGLNILGWEAWLVQVVTGVILVASVAAAGLNRSGASGPQKL
ncbi:MAG: ABC transporter permease [Solirubrobacterales bacterium]